VSARFQSGFRSHSTTETGNVQVVNVLSPNDSGTVLLDLYAAFDTIDHETFTNRLATNVEVAGIALS